MKITNIHAENYKTYKELDLDLCVEEYRPIILIGGGNGCGKTTLFDAIYHALYGLEIKNAKDFEELFNSGVAVEQGLQGKQIVLEISFNGIVLNQVTPYRLKRIYRHNDGKLQWSVELNMNGNKYVYGNATPASERNQMEAIVNKIIAANLPSELSNYFLFDAMKTSDLVKEEQINKLIMNNINSVMGFSKYERLKVAASTLLEHRKGEKLENENQRKEYELLGQEKKYKETQLADLNSKYEKALQFSLSNKEEYEQLKDGRNLAETVKDKIEQQQQEIKRVETESSEYFKEMTSFTKDLEKHVLFPKIASEIKAEVELILSEKQNLAKERGSQLSEEQIVELVNQFVDILAEQHASLLCVDAHEVAKKILRSKSQGLELSETFKYLNDQDVQELSQLVNGSYANPFVQLDNKRENLIADIKALPEKKRVLEDYRRSIDGNDYSMIARYEDNEQNIQKLKQEIEAMRKEIKSLENKIAKYDYDIPQEPDPQYDLLCKLPDFFKTLSSKLLANKRKNIEDMMKEQLNVNLVAYAGVIGRVSLEGATADDINFKIYHKNGNEIFLSQLNAGAKQTVMQVLLKVLYELGDYNPPVMIDTVMGVLDKESREVILENYFPNLAEQTILLSTDTEITTERDFKKIAPFVAKSYTLHRDKEKQCTNISNDYFGLTANED